MAGPSSRVQSMKRPRMADESHLRYTREEGTPPFCMVSRLLAYDTPISTSPPEHSGMRLRAISAADEGYTPVEGRGGLALVTTGDRSRRKQMAETSRAMEEYMQGRRAYGDEDHFRNPSCSEFVDSAGMSCSYKCLHMMKSEVLEELGLKRAQVLNLEQGLSTLKEAVESANEERKLLVDQIHALEQSVAAAFAREKAAQAARQKDAAAAEERFKQQLSRTEELQVRAQDEMRRRQEAEAAASSAEAKVAASEVVWKRAVEDKVREARNAKSELARVRHEAESSESCLRSELALERREVERAQLRVETLESDLEQLEVELEKECGARQALEIESVKAQAASLSTSRRTDEAEALIKQLHAELAYGAADVAAARQIKERHASVQLLHERVAEEQGRAERAERQLAEKGALERQVAALEAEIEQWTAVARSTFRMESRSGLLDGVAELQREMLAAKEREGHLKGALQESERAIRQLQTRLETAEKSAESAGAEAGKARDELHRMEYRFACVIKEKNGLKSILASYDQEEKAMAAATGQGVTISSFAFDKSKSIRIQECEARLEEARKREMEMEEELKKARDLVDEQRKTAESLQEQLTASNTDLQSLRDVSRAKDDKLSAQFED